MKDSAALLDFNMKEIIRLGNGISDYFFYVLISWSLRKVFLCFAFESKNFKFLTPFNIILWNPLFARLRKQAPQHTDKATADLPLDVSAVSNTASAFFFRGKKASGPTVPLSCSDFTGVAA